MIKLKFLLFIIASANLNLILFSIWCFITFVASLVHCECNSLHTFIFIEYFMSGQHHAFQKRKKVIHLKREEQQLTSIIIQSIRVIWLYSRVVDKIFWNFPLHSFLKHMSTLFIFNKTSFKSPESYSTVSCFGSNQQYLFMLSFWTSLKIKYLEGLLFMAGSCSRNTDEWLIISHIYFQTNKK